MNPTQVAKRDALIEESQQFTQAIVRRMMKSMSLDKEMYDDLLAAAYLGLVEAANNFNEDRGSAFTSFAYLRIRGAVIDTIRKNSSLSKNSYRYGKALEAMQLCREADLEEKKVVKSSAEEVLGNIFDIAAKGALAYRLSYEEHEEEAADTKEEHENPEELLEKKEIQHVLKEIIATLPEKERLVIEGYYFNGKSFVEIADELDGVSKSWLSRLHSKAIDTVKKRYLESLRD